MRRIAFATTTLLALEMILASAVAAQNEPGPGYLDVMICKVKPDKRADFDAICKKTAGANRRHKGDPFVASETVYGEQNTVSFISGRQNYAAIDQGSAAFEGAMKEAFGLAGGMQLEKDFNNCLVSSRGELWRGRPDLSFNVPKDPAAIMKTIGESRWVRTIAVHVRPGRIAEFEIQAKALKEGLEKTPGPMTLANQAELGQQGTVFNFSTFRSSLAGFDTELPTLRESLGEEGYREFQKGSSDNVLRTEVTIGRFLPELSNAPKEFADASPDFWKPKAAAPSRSKPKPEAAKATK